ncbi:AAA family ATPase [Pseudoalteromonas sp. S16_S37]|uniref:AAA family ATPase n=1 Tax=Pseudoalteromonas sp. S16_S37 TaxID=2720228 RepID=UPI001681180E|nr:ParA family protein [Pseudoalteromonas sp. S16_S37]
MKIWTVANQKGGVGKTTTTVSLGGILALQGKRVLLIDTDPHASLTYYFGIDSEELEISVYDIFARGSAMQSEEILQALCPSTIENLDILPATMAIATLDRSMGNRAGMGLVLKKALEKISEHYDYAILDCPPVLGVLMVNALAASERVLIPVQTEFLALKGLDRMMRTMELMQSSQSKQYQYTIIPTMYDKRTKASLEAYKSLLASYKDCVWPGVIPVDTKFRDASLAQKVPVEYCPKSRGVFAYRALLDYLMQVK